MDVEVHSAALAAIRQLNGLSQAELSRRSSVSQGHISELEAGKRDASPSTIKKLAEALGVPMAAIAAVRVAVPAVDAVEVAS